MKDRNRATIYAILAATLYAINIPLSKMLITFVEPTMMAAFLYLGAGVGLFLYGVLEKVTGKTVKREYLTRKELPYTVAMVILDVVAPIFLMFGIKMSVAANVSLMNNFEIVSTSIIATVVFKEVLSKRLLSAIVLITVASTILTFEGMSSFEFNNGSLFVLGACICWGFENNCTKIISNKSSAEIVIIKGIFSGLGSILVAFVAGEKLPAIQWVICTLLLGFIAYGLSIHFYIMAQKNLGTAKTSAYYSITPFLGAVFGMLILGERPQPQFYVALIIMMISTWFMVKDNIEFQNSYKHDNTHKNRKIIKGVIKNG